MPTNEPRTPNTAEMEAMSQRILDIRERSRERVRWNIGKRTAELAIAALIRPTGYRRSGKNRRRKRTKRLL